MSNIYIYISNRVKIKQKQNQGKYERETYSSQYTRGVKKKDKAAAVAAPAIFDKTGKGW